MGWIEPPGFVKIGLFIAMFVVFGAIIYNFTIGIPYTCDGKSQQLYEAKGNVLGSFWNGFLFIISEPGVLPADKDKLNIKNSAKSIDLGGGYVAYVCSFRVPPSTVNTTSVYDPGSLTGLFSGESLSLPIFVNYADPKKKISFGSGTYVFSKKLNCISCSDSDSGSLYDVDMPKGYADSFWTGGSFRLFSNVDVRADMCKGSAVAVNQLNKTPDKICDEPTFLFFWGADDNGYYKKIIGKYDLLIPPYEERCEVPKGYYFNSQTNRYAKSSNSSSTDSSLDIFDYEYGKLVKYTREKRSELLAKYFDKVNEDKNAFVRHVCEVGDGNESILIFGLPFLNLRFIGLIIFIIVLVGILGWALSRRK